MSLREIVHRPAEIPFARAQHAGKLALLPLLRARRRRLRGTTFVAVTGSAGKTTTARLLRALLADRGRVAPRAGSSNQMRKLGRTLAATRRSHRFCVYELAASGPGTLDELLWAYEPDVGVVTSVGSDHLGAFGDLEATAREKSKLVRAIPPAGLVVLNADDERVRAMAAAARARVVLAGRAAEADFRAEDVRSSLPERLSFTLVAAGERFPVRTRLCGEHWTAAALVALATALELGVPPGAAVARLATVEPAERRLSVVEAGGVTYLRDDYKAPVWTVTPALEVLGAARARRRIAVLGQVSDDRRRPRVLYPALAREARLYADLVVLVGRWAHHGLRARTDEDDGTIVAFEEVAPAARFLEELLQPGDVVLLKGTAKQADLGPIVGATTARARPDALPTGYN